MNKELNDSLQKSLGISQEQIVREEYEMIILKKLFESGIGKSFVFKGGTALRLAYGSPRFSEDLDFSTVFKFDKDALDALLKSIDNEYEVLELVEVRQKHFTYFALFKIKERFMSQAFSIKFEVSTRTVKWQKDKDYQLLALSSKVTNLTVLAQVVTPTGQEVTSAMATKKMNYSAVNCGVSLRASSSVNHSSPQQVFDSEVAQTRGAARYSGSRISNIELLQILKGFNKSYFTVADLEKILKMKRDVLYVTLNRLVKSGVLIRLKRGVYQPEFQTLELEKTANELYYPSYLSFESALSRYGILSQIPYSLTFATTKTTKRGSLAGKEIEYKQLKAELFFGYTLVDGIYLAEPEKAVLDQLYFISKGRIVSNVAEWSLVALDKEKLLRYSKKFPQVVQRKIKELVPRMGKYVVSL